MVCVFSESPYYKYPQGNHSMAITMEDTFYKLDCRKLLVLRLDRSQKETSENPLSPRILSTHTQNAAFSSTQNR